MLTISTLQSIAGAQHDVAFLTMKGKGIRMGSIAREKKKRKRKRRKAAWRSS